MSLEASRTGHVQRRRGMEYTVDRVRDAGESPAIDYEQQSG
jgi:hypothetical protein